MAIILVLAAILFPVFATVKAAALKTVCQQNYKQAYTATMLYVGDYDDRLMLTNHQPTQMNSRFDRTWVQLLLPYTDFSEFHCPADRGPRPKPEATFDQDLIPGDATSQYYQASQRSNIGYNYLYLAPVVNRSNNWVAEPHMMSEVGVPPKSLLFIDTVYEVVNGTPTGGGSYLAIPPCRYELDSSLKIDSFFQQAAVNSPEVLTANPGWTGQPDTTFVYGGAWPWHTGRMTTVTLAGNAQALTPDQLGAGCEVKTNWTGLISDGSKYLWHIKD
jgi:hypothetical protein